MIPRIVTAVFAVGLALLPLGEAPATAQPNREPNAVELESLERLALENHPAIATARGRLASARGAANQAGRLPNPIAGYVGDDLGEPGEHGIFVEQMIPLGGKLATSRQVGEAEVRRLEALLETERLRVLTAVRVRFAELSIAARRLEIRRRLAGLAEDAVVVTGQLFNVGASDRPDILAIEMEAERARVELAAAEAALDRRRVMLALAVGDPDLPVPVPTTPVGDVVPAIDRDAALARVLAESPEVRAAEREVERQELALRRARRESVPNLFARADALYRRERFEPARRPAGWNAAVELGVNVPVFDRNQGAVAAAVADAEVARLALDALRLELRARFADVYEAYRVARTTAEIYREEVLPRAEAAFETYLASYQSMAASFPQVLIAQRALFESSERYLDAVEAAERARARIEGVLVN